jgi:hypothetical protein
MARQLPLHILMTLLVSRFSAVSCTAASTPKAAAAVATNSTAAAANVPAPSFCRTGKAAAYAAAAGPTSMSWGGNMLKVYRNLYHHNKKWFAVIDSSSTPSSIDEGMSSNTVLVKLPTTDSEAFQENIKVRSTVTALGSSSNNSTSDCQPCWLKCDMDALTANGAEAYA